VGWWAGSGTDDNCTDKVNGRDKAKEGGGLTVWWGYVVGAGLDQSITRE
jgi:hypothetical protein